jgi:hypothetical protein
MAIWRSEAGDGASYWWLLRRYPTVKPYYCHAKAARLAGCALYTQSLIRRVAGTRWLDLIQGNRETAPVNKV